MSTRVIYYFYCQTACNCHAECRMQNAEGNIVRIIKPNGFSFHNIAWKLFSLNKFCEYQLCDKNGQVLSFAQVMPKIFIFNFMKAGLHIGPCATKKEYRGRGYYPFLLKKIVSDYSKQYSEFYIFCDKNNIASQRGIEKAGFHKIGIGIKNKLGIYKITKFIL